MAYQNKYKATFATKTGKTVELYLLENDYDKAKEYLAIYFKDGYLTTDNNDELVFFSKNVTNLLNLSNLSVCILS